MAADVIVRPLAEADAREAAFWYERKRDRKVTKFIEMIRRLPR